MSRSDPNCVNASSSLYCASSSFTFDATCFIAFICALPPTLDTETPGFIAGLNPELNRSVSKNICPSVIEITFVGIYAEISPAFVSTIGNAVIDPPPSSSLSFAALSSSLE